MHWQSRLYMSLRRPMQPLMRSALKKRIASGKELPGRSGEKLGQATQARPSGPLIWCHAVGLGEVLALRPLILQMQQDAPDVQILVTSTARASAQVIGDNLPKGCIHQFLPMDGQDFMAAFLNHWQPNLVIWSEQDLWPGASFDCAKRGIPQAYINARMNDTSAKKRARFGGLYQDIFSRYALIATQDPITLRNLTAFGAKDPVLMGSLKPAAPPLACDPNELENLQDSVGSRPVWVAASTHAPDEPGVIAAHQALLNQHRDLLLIITPRVPARADEIVDLLEDAGLRWQRRSIDPLPHPDTQVLLADSFGELGLWYRLSKIAFIGASFADLGGHNPWEAICLGVPVLHGDGTHNFISDYRTLDHLGLARLVTPESLPQAWQEMVQADIAAQATHTVEAAKAALIPLAAQLLALMKPNSHNT